MEKDDVIDWLYDEAVSVLTDSTHVSLGTPGDHVGLAERRDDQTYPFVGIQEIATSQAPQGIGNGDVYVADTTYTSGTLQSITYGVEPTLRVELIPLTDGDRRLRDQLTSELADHFSILARTESYGHADVENVATEEGTPQNRSSEFVYAEGVPVEVTYQRYTTDTDPDVVDEVNVDVDVSDTPLDDSDDADGFDESF